MAYNTVDCHDSDKSAYNPAALRKKYGIRENKVVLYVSRMKKSKRIEVLLDALRRAGATFEGETKEAAGGKALTKADFYALGFSGRADSGAKRKALARSLGFPEKMTADALLDAVNTMLLAGRLELSFFDAYRADHPDQQDG